MLTQRSSLAHCTFWARESWEETGPQTPWTQNTRDFSPCRIPCPGKLYHQVPSCQSQKCGHLHLFSTWSPSVGAPNYLSDVVPSLLRTCHISAIVETLLSHLDWQTDLQLDSSVPSFWCWVSPPTNVYGALKQIWGYLPRQYRFSPSSLPTESQFVQESNMQFWKKNLTFPGFATRGNWATQLWPIRSGHLSLGRVSFFEWRRKRRLL